MYGYSILNQYTVSIHHYAPVFATAMRIFLRGNWDLYSSVSESSLWFSYYWDSAEPWNLLRFWIRCFRNYSLLTLSMHLHNFIMFAVLRLHHDRVLLVLWRLFRVRGSENPGWSHGDITPNFSFPPRLLYLDFVFAILRSHNYENLP